jgi:UDP-2,3-diacylglucosamine hydrolase
MEIQGNVLFLSDFHLGAPNRENSLKREQKICELLDAYFPTSDCLFLMGDVFDFWFEYKTVVPIGFYRFQGRLAAWADAGKKIYLMIGNHDMWIFDKWAEEFNIIVLRDPILATINQKKVFLAHGDGLGPGDWKYKLLKKVFRSPFCIFLFRWLHPDIGVNLAQYLSRRSRKTTGTKEDKYFGRNREWLYQFSKATLEKKSTIDYFIFGHRHLPIYQKIEDSNSIYINLGDWIQFDTYATADSKGFRLLKWKTELENEAVSLSKDA